MSARDNRIAGHGIGAFQITAWNRQGKDGTRFVDFTISNRWLTYDQETGERKWNYSKGFRVNWQQIGDFVLLAHWLAFESTKWIKRLEARIPKDYMDRIKQADYVFDDE